MTTYFVSRHSGAVEWAKHQGIEAEFVPHLNVENIQAGDIVMGTLPVNLAAGVIARGGNYFHLTMDIPEDRRGDNLSADNMKAFGAVLEKFHVRREL